MPSKNDSMQMLIDELVKQTKNSILEMCMCMLDRIHQVALKSTTEDVIELIWEMKNDINEEAKKM